MNIKKIYVFIALGASTNALAAPIKPDDRPVITWEASEYRILWSGSYEDAYIDVKRGDCNVCEYQRFGVSGNIELMSGGRVMSYGLDGIPMTGLADIKIDELNDIIISINF